MLEAIIFDVDGTLWDAREQVQYAWDMAKRELYGAPFTIDFDIFTGLFGQTMDKFAPYLFPGEPLEEAVAKSDAVLMAQTRWLRETPGMLYDGVPEMLRELSERYSLFIVSNCQLGYIETLIDSYRLEPYITDHLCYGETHTTKGQTIRTIMQRHGVTKAVYVGDTQGDADSCAEAGVPFLFVEYGFGSVGQEFPRARTVAEIPQKIAEMAQTL